MCNNEPEIFTPSVDVEMICSQVREGVCFMMFYLSVKVLLYCALLAFVALSPVPMCES